MIFHVWYFGIILHLTDWVLFILMWKYNLLQMWTIKSSLLVLGQGDDMFLHNCVIRICKIWGTSSTCHSKWPVIQWLRIVSSSLATLRKVWMKGWLNRTDKLNIYTPAGFANMGKSIRCIMWREFLKMPVMDKLLIRFNLCSISSIVRLLNPFAAYYFLAIFLK